MFLGTYTPKLDEKGRLILPAKFREQLAPGLVVTRAQDRCLAIYPMATFEEMTAQFQQAPMTMKNVRDFQRMLAAGASDEIPDKQGRITIPAGLRQYAGLSSEVVVVGAINRVEVWDTKAWEEYSAAQEDVFAGMNEDVLPSF